MCSWSCIEVKNAVRGIIWLTVAHEPIGEWEAENAVMGVIWLAGTHGYL